MRYASPVQLDSSHFHLPLGTPSMRKRRIVLPCSAMDGHIHARINLYHNRLKYAPKEWKKRRMRTALGQTFLGTGWYSRQNLPVELITDTYRRFFFSSKSRIASSISLKVVFSGTICGGCPSSASLLDVGLPMAAMSTGDSILSAVSDP